MLPRVAAGELSVKHALREVARKSEKGTPGHGYALPASEAETVERALHRIEQVIRAEWGKCPLGQRAKFLHGLQLQLETLMPQRVAAGTHRDNIRMVGSPTAREAMRASH
jgi:hypothetical protein